MLEAVGEFFRTGKLLKQINTTLLALIPKVNMPTYVSDYRPISCCNVLYKAITKIIVKRIQRVLPLLINYSQNAFVPGRSISDNILLAQELLAGYNQTRLPERCTLKVDIQKAYDSVEWDFLLEVLRLFNFPTHFITLIVQCVSTASFSVSLNGAIHGFFKGGRGLRQGDPMSPYLFVLVMEVGSALLRYRVQQSPQFQYHWKCKDLGLINLCFADDVLLFCKADIPSIKLLTETLSEFATFSGLKVNPSKSQIIFSRAVQQRQQLLDCVGPLIDKVDTRLAGWNHQHLSYAGRLQLIKSVLSTLHMYWASVFILPKGVLKMLERKMRTFLWQGPSGGRQAKVAWDQICKPKAEGGLGLRSLIIMNQALILKQMWRVLQNDGSSIWVDWIQRYRLRHSTLWTFNRTTGSWCWKKMLKLRPILRRGAHYKRITAEPMVLAGCDTDIAEIMSLLPPTNPSTVDEICWRSNSGKFTLQSAILLLQPPSPHVLWQGLLHGKIQDTKARVYSLVSYLGKTLHHGSTMGTKAENGCVLCGGQFSESHDHLFFKCWFSKRCLTILKHKVRFPWPYLEWKRGILWASKRFRGTHIVNAALRATLAALVYHIWAERNCRKFAATASSAELISNRVLEDIRMRIMAADIPPSLQTRFCIGFGN
ncbi:UNVERIFIED_CONTAM: hypothetical protein Scaly_3082300 [Sesamum calycinum]|uniref:Reverse transcriptase domain-containing protein n=1 Tax=Sesamum calycinum TaxID=2727403 RepID=A0AAW2JV65_9LAMI